MRTDALTRVNERDVETVSYGSGSKPVMMEMTTTPMVAVTHVSNRVAATVSSSSENVTMPNDDDSDDCTRACRSARCGDELVRVGVEACDDGNLNDADQCLSDCRRLRWRWYRTSG